MGPGETGSVKWHREEAWCQREGVQEGAEPGLRGVNKQAGRAAAAGEDSVCKEGWDVAARGGVVR